MIRGGLLGEASFCVVWVWFLSVREASISLSFSAWKSVGRHESES